MTARRADLRLLPPAPEPETLPGGDEREPDPAEARMIDWLIDEAIRELMEERRGEG